MVLIQEAERFDPLQAEEGSVAPLTNPPEAYLTEKISTGRMDSAIHIEFEPFKAAVEALGGQTAILMPDPSKEYVIASQHIYWGATTPRAKHEIPHFHTEQTEIYHIVSGNATMWVQRYWEGGRWQLIYAHPGDSIVVNPQTCHFFEWVSEDADGLAYVYKNPIPGIGRPPAGKQICANCPMQNTCIRPPGFAV